MRDEHETAALLRRLAELLSPKQTPDAFDITVSIGDLDAARAGVRIGARHLRRELAQNGPAVAIERTR
jgi:hypothetical protein